jgi:hypothetical protein
VVERAAVERAAEREVGALAALVAADYEVSLPAA